MNRLNRDEYRDKSCVMTVREEVLRPTDGVPGVEFPVLGLREWLRRECATTWAACGMFEYVAFTYLGVSSALIALFAENLAHPLRLIATQGFVASLILLLCRVEKRVVRHDKFSPEAESETTEDLPPALSEHFWHFWRCWYPHLFFLFCFEELGWLVHLLQPGWQDAKLIAFDHWLTGVHPTVWLEQFATPARNDFMQFIYITYFTYLLFVGGILYYRRDWRGYWSVMTYSAVGYAIGYVIAICFPIESPWFAMAGSWQGELRGGAATTLINFIEHYGRVRGAAFPSEHVAGAAAATWGAWRHRRWLFWVMLPLVLCMCVSTVWGRYHYVADVFGGMITGTLGYVIGRWLMTRRGSVKET
ncbi:MAG TPA: phosphatase PAP2 family protein [Candidatus Methylomirabilis sp.]|nr:phosphatase PAP2 family protein [Candidatus Methylomirabilis sp.]